MGKGNNNGQGLKNSCLLFSKKNIKKIIKILKKVVDFLKNICYIIITARATAHNMKGIENMVVATYESKRKAQPEHIRVHKYSDGKLRVEAISVFYAHEVGGVYDTIEQVEQYLNQRDRIFGYVKTS